MHATSARFSYFRVPGTNANTFPVSNFPRSDLRGVSGSSPGIVIFSIVRRLVSVRLASYRWSTIIESTADRLFVFFFFFFSSGESKMQRSTRVDLV